MNQLTSGLKKILGKNLTKSIRPLGHGVKSYLAAVLNNFPSKQLKIIGITGTKGKTTTTLFTGRLLNLAGIKTGYISTAAIYLGDEAASSQEKEFANPYKMTTIDGFVMQKYLKKMLENGCTHVVLEMSSQGLEQNRHWGIQGFDYGLFLNLYPEHLEAHGGLENYKKCKGKLFQNMLSNGVFIGNKSDSITEFMWQSIPETIRSTVKKVLVDQKTWTITASEEHALFKKIDIDGQRIQTRFVADFEVTNSMFALEVLKQILGTLSPAQYQLISKLGEVPGRMEWVTPSELSIKHQNLGIMVDYAHEPESMRQLLETIQEWKVKGFYTQLIHILSCDGVGRDDWKKPIMGKTSYEKADFTILTTDNFEDGDNPEDILDALSETYPKQNLNIKYFREPQRRQAFKKALSLATDLINKGERVIIVSTGVGNEQGLTQPGGKMEWNEKQVWLEELNVL
jgi:UDP-N-acetylmuramoyl-L-alanyl-D-glutamate--2,6-diaminopimelate ligase